VGRAPFYFTPLFAGVPKKQEPPGDCPGVRYERMYESISSASAYCFGAAAGAVVAGLVSFIVLACLVCFFADFFELFAVGALLCVAGAVWPS
jgi:hypothetical protein